MCVDYNIVGGTTDSTVNDFFTFNGDTISDSFLTKADKIFTTTDTQTNLRGTGEIDNEDDIWFGYIVGGVPNYDSL